MPKDNQIKTTVSKEPQTIDVSEFMPKDTDIRRPVSKKPQTIDVSEFMPKDNQIKTTVSEESKNPELVENAGGEAGFEVEVDQLRSTNKPNRPEADFRRQPEVRISHSQGYEKSVEKISSGPESREDYLSLIEKHFKKRSNELRKPALLLMFLGTVLPSLGTLSAAKAYYENNCAEVAA